jgi:hypothetical protein
MRLLMWINCQALTAWVISSEDARVGQSEVRPGMARQNTCLFLGFRRKGERSSSNPPVRSYNATGRPVSAIKVQTKERRDVRCPQCGRPMPLSKLLFREDFRCMGCHVPLHVSVAYSRVLVLLSALASLVLLWELGIRDLRLFFFLLPLGFLILTLIVRAAPFVVPPRLYIGKPSVITKLDLSS